MAKEYKGLIGKIAKDLFHDGAKGKTVTKEVTWKTAELKAVTNAWAKSIEDTIEGVDPHVAAQGLLKSLEGTKEHKRTVTADLYKYTDKLGKYAGIGAASLISPDKDKPIDVSLLRGAIWGTMMGAGVNVLPKFIHNSYSKHGFRRLNVDMEEYINDTLKAYSPVIAEFDNPVERELKRKAKAEKEKIKKDRQENPLRRMNEFFDEHKKASSSNSDFPQEGSCWCC